MEKNWVSVLTAQDATSTVKTLIDTIEVPKEVSKLVEIGTQVSIPGCTTLEDISWVMEVECINAPWGGGQQFVSDAIVPTAPVNACLIPSKIHDCDLPVSPGMKLNLYTTFNLALTINAKVRYFGKFR
ncbi:unnamed protein product [marine sediment metagenome]|uniref:Uncharacterized protein n=1 Tax=marine sediment metagenome TaxID=412755 RepID=X1UH97_9ZZZZ